MKSEVSRVVLRNQMEVIKELGVHQGLPSIPWNDWQTQVGDEMWTLSVFNYSTIIDVEKATLVYCLQEVAPYQRSKNWRLFEVKLEAEAITYAITTRKQSTEVRWRKPRYSRK